MNNMCRRDGAPRLIVSVELPVTQELFLAIIRSPCVQRQSIRFFIDSDLIPSGFLKPTYITMLSTTRSPETAYPSPAIYIDTEI